MNDSFIFGASPLERVVGCEVDNNKLFIFIQNPDGTVTTRESPIHLWLLSSKQIDGSWLELQGAQHYRWLKIFTNSRSLWDYKKSHPNCDFHHCYDEKEQAMILGGFTYYKGLKHNEVSALAFDIESTTLDPHDPNAKVLLISNTFRDHRGNVERKLFAFDEYETAAGLFRAWTTWVQEKDPSLVIGHNIFGFDFIYIDICARNAGCALELGRNRSELHIPSYELKYRRDGSQFYKYRNARIWGREIVDTFFLSMKYDVARRYPNFKLKDIIRFEKLEVKNRQHYEAGEIHKRYQDPAEWEKIKAYAMHDADDALALFDLQAPSLFYLNRSIPKSFQSIVNGASGSWLNSFLVRSYLSENHSIPKASTEEKYEGAISLGNPGIYHDVFKVDVASLYPSIMLQYGIYDEVKDPSRNFQRMVEYFTNERLSNKKHAKDTGDRYYKDLEQSQKIVINSAYGMLGTPGLNFNSPRNAALVTAKGREILTNAMHWAEVCGFWLVNADTDSISISQERPWSDWQKQRVLDELNALSPERIRWEDDGLYDRVMVLKIKNYVLEQNGKRTTKGAAIKATMKEPALREFIDRLVTCLFAKGDAVALYNEYASEILNLTDINRWASKKTVTEAVLEGTRTTEQRICDALDDDVQQGDKVFVYFTHDDIVKQSKDWCNDHDERRLFEKLYKTLVIFKPVLGDLKPFRNWSLKGSDKFRSHLTKKTNNETLKSEEANNDCSGQCQDGNIATGNRGSMSPSANSSCLGV